MAKVIFNNKNYNINESALASAVTALEKHLRSMAGGGDEPVAGIAGLYQTGAIALYEEQGTEAIEDMMTKSWDDLVAEGMVHVEDGVVYTNFKPDSYINTDALVGDLILPNDGSIISIAARGFSRCSGLTGIYLPDIVDINDKAFTDCDALTIVNAPLATYIGIDAFLSCDSLINVILPNAQTIRGAAFASCPSLTKVDLPKVTTIKAEAFEYSLNVNAIILRTTETVCEIDITAFVLEWSNENVPKTINDNFYIPASMYEAYRSVYAPAFEQAGFAGMFEVVFHKIEDLPEE